jgi:hypothetical protein
LPSSSLSSSSSSSSSSSLILSDRAPRRYVAANAAQELAAMLEL